jgi:ectoine hydroxylase-related dioxygenase (phytanoyl-CoA dioxygenase family)
LSSYPHERWVARQKSACSLPDFAALVDRTTEPADYPYAAGVEQKVLVYDAAALRQAITTTTDGRLEVEAELVRALTDGPGVVALKGAFPDPTVVDRATAAFEEIIAAERASTWRAQRHLRARLPGLAAAGVPGVLRVSVRAAAAGQGCAAFFNPALFHGAGTNLSADVQRKANLLQVSSAFGRAMETVDRAKVSRAISPILRARKDAGVDPASLAHALACAAEGYPFPSNLDLDANVDGLTPLSQAQVVQRGLDEGWSADRMEAELEAYDVRHRTDEI